MTKKEKMKTNKEEVVFDCDVDYISADTEPDFIVMKGVRYVREEQKDEEWREKMIEVLGGCPMKYKKNPKGEFTPIENGYNVAVLEFKNWQQEQINKLTK